MVSLDFLGGISNTVNSIGNVFSNFFDLLLFNVIAPILMILFFLIFLAINYYAIKGHVWLFSRGFEILIQLIDVLKQKEKSILERFSD